MLGFRFSESAVVIEHIDWGNRWWKLVAFDFPRPAISAQFSHRDEGFIERNALTCIYRKRCKKECMADSSSGRCTGRKNARGKSAIP